MAGDRARQQAQVAQVAEPKKDKKARGGFYGAMAQNAPVDLGTGSTRRGVFLGG